MSFSSTTARVQASGNGSTVDFPVTFPFQADADIAVIVTTSGVDATQTLGVHYTVSGEGTNGGGNVRFITAPASGTTVTIYRDIDLNQTRSFTYNGSFPTRTVTDAADKAMQSVQQLNEQMGRALRIPISNDGVAEIAINDRKNKTVTFDADGNLSLAATVDLSGTIGDEAIGEDQIERTFRTRVSASYAAAKTDSYASAFTNERVELLGRSARGDGGEGLFYIDKADTTTAEDGGLVLVASDGTRLKRVYSGAVKVPWWGTDRTAAQAALTSVSAGGCVHFAKGDYSLSGSITLTNSAPVNIYGDGDGSVLTFTSADNGIVIAGSNVSVSSMKITGAASRMIFSNTASTNVRLSNLDISGATVAPALLTIGGIYLDNVGSATIEKCYVHGCGQASTPRGHAIVFNSGSSLGAYVSGVHVKNCRVEAGDCAFGITLFNCNDSSVIGCTVDGSVLDATDASGYGITAYAKSGTVSRNVITGNIVSNCKGSGVYGVDSQDSVFTGNIIKNCAQTQTDASLPVGLIALNACAGSVVDGNRMDQSGRKGLVVVGDDVTISGNHITNTGSEPLIHLRGNCSNVCVTCNTLSDGNFGVYTNGTATACTITGNNGNTLTYFAFLTTANYCQITGNSAQALGDGIVVPAGGGNGITGNTMKGASTTGNAVNVGCSDSIVGLNRGVTFTTPIVNSGSGNTVVNNL